MSLGRWLRALSTDLAGVRQTGRPRLLLLVGSLPDDMVGGMQGQAERMASELGRDYDVVVLSRALRKPAGVEHRGSYRVLRRPVVSVPRVRGLLDAAVCFWHAIWLGRGAVCILAYQTIISGLVAVLAGRILRTPSVVSIRSADEFTSDLQRPGVRALSRLIWRQASRIVVQSPRIGQAFVAQATAAGVSASSLAARVGIAGNGIDMPDLADDMGTGLIYVGRLHPVKGLHVLLAALEQLPPNQRPCLTVVGDGPLRAQLEQRGDLPLRIVGEADRDAVLQYLRAAGIFVLPAISEGMSNAVMEAMAVGVPVIATRVAGMADLIVDGQNGVLVPPDDPAALRGAIERLQADQALCRRLIAGGRATAAERSWARARSELVEQIRLAR